MQQKQQADVAHLVAGAVEAEEVHQAVVDARWQAEGGGQLVAPAGGSGGGTGEVGSMCRQVAACLPSCRRVLPSWLARLAHRGLILPAATALSAHRRRRSRAWQEKQEPKLHRKLPAGRRQQHNWRLRAGSARLGSMPRGSRSTHAQTIRGLQPLACWAAASGLPHRRGRQTGRRHSRRCSS